MADRARALGRRFRRAAQRLFVIEDEDLFATADTEPGAPSVEFADDVRRCLVYVSGGDEAAMVRHAEAMAVALEACGVSTRLIVRNGTTTRDAEEAYAAQPTTHALAYALGVMRECLEDLREHDARENEADGAASKYEEMGWDGPAMARRGLEDVTIVASPVSFAALGLACAMHGAAHMSDAEYDEFAWWVRITDHVLRCVTARYGRAYEVVLEGGETDFPLDDSIAWDAQRVLLDSLDEKRFDGLLAARETERALVEWWRPFTTERMRAQRQGAAATRGEHAAAMVGVATHAGRVGREAYLRAARDLAPPDPLLLSHTAVPLEPMARPPPAPPSDDDDVYPLV